MKQDEIEKDNIDRLTKIDHYTTYKENVQKKRIEGYETYKYGESKGRKISEEL